MLEALKVIGRAFRLWWGELLLLTALNVAWLALQVPIVTGPPATAAMYVIVRRLVDGDLVGPRDAWQALRQMFWPAWIWGLLNLVIAGVVGFNFITYGSAPGPAWAALRLAWGTIALLWFAVNLFYWPFWLAQSDRRPTLTLRNGLLLYLRAPGFGLTLLLTCAVLTVVSVLTTVPLAAALVSWLSLIGIMAVDVALRRPEAAEPGPATEIEVL